MNYKISKDYWTLTTTTATKYEKLLMSINVEHRKIEVHSFIDKGATIPTTSFEK